MLVRAFIRALEIDPALRSHLRLAIIGDGPLRTECEQLLAVAGVSDLAWLPGERHDVPEIMGGLDCFVLPSLAEGISNTILEAMASGLPVIATDVGGNTDLVATGMTGQIVPAGNPEALAHQIAQLANNPDHARRMGRLGRQRVEEKFSMNAMTTAYLGAYDKLLGRVGASA